ncbi:MAG: PAS domain S-box protein [Richelia sp. SL_2_1]|nr:PAS domain S-box protein [Richelia sp. SM1_7_0]NJN10702.1 PAS domain S-box protein [Richelia sp. RM1_1_1]NJO31419.1 PAS domain S-box protein [Richelia sp. SL_2_1]
MTGEDIFIGNSEMAVLMRSFDWSQTSLGTVENWSQSLKTTLNILLTSRQPIFLFWGEELIQFYNDAYRLSLGPEKHPQALGAKGREFWTETWHIIGEQIDAAMKRGESSWNEDHLVPIIRNGYLEEVYWTYGYSPVRDDNGEINGTLVISTETTERVIGERQLRIQRELATGNIGVKSVEQVCQVSAGILGNNPEDVPFALLYLLNDKQNKAQLNGVAGFDAGTLFCPQEIEIDSENEICQLWSLSTVLATGKSQIIEGLQLNGELSKTVAVVPLIASGQVDVKGFLIAGISPIRPYNADYRGFFDLVAGQIATAISNARAWEIERSTAQVLETARIETTAAETRAQDILSSIRDGFAALNRNWQFIDVNHRQVEIMGMNREEILGKSLWEIYQDLIDSEFEHYAQQVMVERNSRQFEFYYPTWNRWFEIRLYPTPEGIVIITADINERKQAATALAESEARFRQMAETIENVFWLHDLQTDQLLYLSPAFEEIWGRSREYIYDDSHNLIETIHPEHREQMQTAPQRCLANNGNIEEYRIVRPDGSIRWIRDRGFVVQDGSTKPYRLAGVAEDITEEKQADAALRESERRLRRLVESNMFGVVFGDGSGGLRYANDYFLNMTGYTIEEIESGQVRWDELTPPEFAPLDAKAIEELTTKGVCTPYEKEYLHKNGQQIPILIGAAAIDEPFNQNQEVVAFIINLTQPKQITEERDRFFELSGDMMAIANFGGYFTQVNPAWEKTLGWTAKELKTKPYLEFIHPDDVASTIAEAEKVAQGFNTTGYENRYRRKDGSYRWLLWNVATYPKLGVFYCVAHDITEQKQTELALRESELNFRTLTNSMPQIIWTSRPDGFTDYYNQRWFNYTGMTLEQTQGRGWEPVLHPDDLQKCIDVWSESLRTGNSYHIEYRFRRASDGEYRWFLGRAVPLRNENGQIVKWFGSCTDIQDQKCAQEAAEEANRVKDQFLAVLSHELRTPLNPILGWTKILQKGELDAQKTQIALQTIERNAKLQTRLIDDLLDISRIIRGKLSLEVAPVDLTTVIQAALETVQLAAEAKSITIHTVKSSSVGIVKGDAGRLQQVVWNILSNAVKFTPQNGHISIELTQLDNYAQIQVKDTGKGINKEFLPYLFEHFRQEDSATTRKFGGLGLGLAIARQIVELHGGIITADSPGEQQGAIFTVKIPIR